MKTFTNPTKVVTGICTFSYLNCWDPKSINGGTPKFSVSLIIPKSDTKTIEKIKAAGMTAYLPKPLVWEELIAVLERYCEKADCPLQGV